MEFFVFRRKNIFLPEASTPIAHITSHYICPVKNTGRYFGALLLTAIYCFAISFVSKSSLYASSPSGTFQEQKESFSPLTSVLLQHTATIAVSSSAHVSFEGFKSGVEKLCIGSVTAEVFLQSEFSQYFVFSKNLLINSRKTDLIFPFHYFW